MFRTERRNTGLGTFLLRLRQFYKGRTTTLSTGSGSMPDEPNGRCPARRGAETLPAKRGECNATNGGPAGTHLVFFEALVAGMRRTP